MTVLGITGGIGAGKSRILDILRNRYGVCVIQADLVAKQLEEPGQPGYERLVDQFGEGILEADKSLCKARFSAMIFSDEEALCKVNAIIHPLTWEAVKARIAAAENQVTAVEAALFDETSRELCQYLVYVDVSEENRIRRLMENRGYSREKCLAIMKNQPDREAYLKLADFVIDNNGTPEQVEEQLAGMMETIGITITTAKKEGGCEETMQLQRTYQ